MKPFVIALLPFLLVACTPSKPASNQPLVVDPHRQAEEAYLQKNQQYVVKKPISKQKEAKQLSKYRWQVTPDSTLELNKRSGNIMRNSQFYSRSTWSIIQHTTFLETERMSYEYHGRNEVSRQILAANNTFLIYESPVWSNHQFILFTRDNLHAPWRSRYVNIPQIPFPGESMPTILRISDTHLWVKDGSNVFCYPLKMLKTTKVDNPFTIG